MPDASPQPTAATTAVVFLDFQKSIIKSNATAKHPEEKAVALAKLATLHGMPVIVSSVPPGGDYFKDILKELPNVTPMPRTFTSAFEDPATSAAITATGRRTLVLAGIASEIVVQRTALAALAQGYTVFVAVDACGGISERTEEAAWMRITQAGGILTSTTTVAAELAGDFTSELGGKTFAIMYETMG